MQELLQKLSSIHNNLNFNKPEQLRVEIPEQIMAIKHILPNDIVLELGGSIGRNSCCINSLLENKYNHVVVEPILNEAIGLLTNKAANDFKFQIETSAISHVPLYSKNWYTSTVFKEGWKQVDTITFDRLYSKYDLKFNVLVIDNEGNFTETLKQYPHILNNIRLIIIEHDFNSEDDLNFFKNTLSSAGFTMSDSYLKTDPFAPGIQWADGLVSDPVFVSAWTR